MDLRSISNRESSSCAARTESPSLRTLDVLLPPQQVPFRERLALKLSDLLIVAGELIDTVSTANSEGSNLQGCPIALRAERRLDQDGPHPELWLSVIALSRGQRVVSNPMILVESQRREALSASDQAMAAHVAGKAEAIFESVSLLMQEMID